MERQRASGLSIVEFCRREGISKATFHVWKRKLHSLSSTRPFLRKAGEPRRSTPKRVSVRRRRETQNPPARSSSPRRSAAFLQLPVPGVPSSPWIELTLVDGTLVRIPQENTAAFAMLLRVLRGDEFEDFAVGARRV
jgi:hypothetical protein